MKMKLAATLTGLMTLLAGQQRCLSADVVLGISSQADKTKTVYWNSEPGAIYRIQSAENLNPVDPNFPARWVTREAEFPSQGTTTLWMDFGDANWIPRIFHPILDD